MGDQTSGRLILRTGNRLQHSQLLANKTRLLSNRPRGDARLYLHCIPNRRLLLLDPALAVCLGVCTCELTHSTHLQSLDGIGLKTKTMLPCLLPFDGPCDVHILRGQDYHLCDKIDDSYKLD